jgi:protein-disulfide isomerase
MVAAVAIAATLLQPSIATAFAQNAASTNTLLPTRGDPSAPVIVLLFSDFECPYCARAESVLQDIRKTFDKEVQIVFKHSPLPIHTRAPLAHEAAVEAARQGRFWEMHDLLFANQQRLDPPQLVEYAQKLGLDMTAFRLALEDRRHRSVVERDVAEARALGVTGTPTLFFNGQRIVGVPSTPQLIASIRNLLDGGGAVADASAPLAPGTLDLTGAPSRGRADAPVTIVEFSDFQCPFCARATGVVENVLNAYGTRVRWVFKHFPLDFHTDAPLAHRAALAAGEQGKFWEMHDAIFRNQSAIKRNDLLRLATTLGLDMARFVADLDSDRLMSVMQRDMADGLRIGVDGTPAFFINGRRLVGAQPFEAFKALIDRELGASARAGAIRPEALDDAMARGPVDAPVTIRWFADLGSPLHRDAVTLLRRVLEAHPADVRLMFDHRPLEGRPERWLAHEAAVAGAEQGKFWELHDVLVAHPGLQDKETLAGYAVRLGLDPGWFEDTLNSGRSRATLERHLADAKALNVRGTPTFLINKTRIDGIVTLGEFERAIAMELSLVKPASR